MLKANSIAVNAILLLLLPSICLSTTYSLSSDSIMKHVSVLADDSLQGRAIGEAGELKAADYIMSIFTTAGLIPKGNDGFLQAYDFIKRIDFGAANRLLINNVELSLDDDYIPLKQSASVEFDFDEIVAVDYGIKTGDDSMSYNDYANKDVDGKAVLIKRYAPSSETNPHVDFDKHASITDKIRTAEQQNAAAIFFVTPSAENDQIKTVFSGNLHERKIPILFIKQPALEKLGLDPDNPTITTAAGQTELVRIRDTSYNVIGYLDNDNDTTVIIGAHYDHLGWGGPSSLYRGEEKMIHNGADDNASGVAAILELARYYAQPENKLNYSLLFIAISGEESGLLGSSYFSKNMTVNQDDVRMMLNIDMIGRLKDQDNGLAIMGVGTSEEFKLYFDSLDYPDLKITTKQSGTGPSDHTIFYNLDIPVLSLFTGPHEDYHKPSDDVDKIDADGIVKAAGFIKALLEKFDKVDGPLTFTKTKDPSAGKRRSQYSVSLGIMPDYVAEVKGLKVGGVVDDRPGQKAGMLKNDIITKMGDIDINDIYDYMSALGKFRKGDTISVIVMRSDQQIELEVTF